MTEVRTIPRVDNISLVAASLEEQINCTPLASGLRRRALLPKAQVCGSQPNHRECPIKAGSLTHVCVDTSVEVEYCGTGCIDCLRQPGVEDVGCEDGSCTAFSCKDGYRLQNGMCV